MFNHAQCFICNALSSGIKCLWQHVGNKGSQSVSRIWISSIYGKWQLSFRRPLLWGSELNAHWVEEHSETAWQTRAERQRLENKSSSYIGHRLSIDRSDAQSWSEFICKRVHTIIHRRCPQANYFLWFRDLHLRALPFTDPCRLHWLLKYAARHKIGSFLYSVLYWCMTVFFDGWLQWLDGLAWSKRPLIFAVVTLCSAI